MQPSERNKTEAERQSSHSPNREQSQNPAPTNQYRSNRSSQPGLPPTMPRSRNQSAQKKEPVYSRSSTQRGEPDRKVPEYEFQSLPRNRPENPSENKLTDKDQPVAQSQQPRDVSPATSNQSGAKKLNVLRDYLKSQKAGQSQPNSQIGKQEDPPSQVRKNSYPKNADNEYEPRARVHDSANQPKLGSKTSSRRGESLGDDALGEPLSQ